MKYKVKIKPFTKCLDCPHVQPNTPTGKLVLCGLTGLGQKYSGNIPVDCPYIDGGEFPFSETALVKAKKKQWVTANEITGIDV